MKRYYSYLMVIAMFLLSSGIGVAMAQSVTIDDITYKLYGDSVHVTGADPFIETAEILSVVTFDGVDYPVKVIGRGAFGECSSLISVTIPESILAIGPNAFAGCDNITDIHIGSLESWLSVSFDGWWAHPNYESSSANIYINEVLLTELEVPSSVTFVPENMFKNCTSITSIIIPKEVTTIKENAFQGCINVESITIHEGVTTIESFAFWGCKSFTSISLPKSITSIGSSAFSSCSSLTSIVVPDGVTSISSSLFSECTNLTSVTLPETITSIGASAFYGCSNLVSVNIPETVTSIGYDAFLNCSKLTSITIPEGITLIERQVFWCCSSLTSINIPQSVDSIGYGAFAGCSKLESVHISDMEAWLEIGFRSSDSNPLTHANNLYLNGELVTEIVLPNTVKTIKNYTFYCCNSLTSVTLPDGVTSIGAGAFWYCQNLGSINIPASVTSFGEEAFWACSKLTSITIPEGMTSLGRSAFEYCGGLVAIEIPNGVTSIGDRAFNGCNNLTSITIPESVTSIGEQAFEGCSSLTSIKIPEGVSVIANATFLDCSSLTSVDIPSSVTSIGERSFRNCESLTSVNIPNGVNRLEKDVFSGCSSLTTITIPEGVTSIGNSAFGHCYNLLSVNIPNTVTSIGSSAFSLCSSLQTIDIPNSVTSIGNSAFYSCRSLVSVTLSNNLSSIGNQMFSNCYSLLTIDIPNSVTSIGEKAFYNSFNLSSINIPYNVSSIGNDAFYNCPITSIFIPKNTTFIGNNAFFECISLSSIVVEDGNTMYDSRNKCNALIESSSNTLLKGCSTTAIPEGVDSIANYAFYQCMDLTSIVIPHGVISIGKEAFRFSTNLASIVIPESVTSIGKNAFENCHIKKVACYASAPPTLYNNQTFDDDVYASVALQVPMESLEAYKSTSGWKRFANIVGLKKYCVTYTVDNKEYITDSLYEGTCITMPKIEGYTFHPIGELPDVMPANDTIINGYLAVNSYRVTYMVDSEVHYTDSAVYNEKIILPTAPVKEGYTFAGWEGLPEIMPAEDVTVVGRFTINSYKITYMVDGKEHHTDSVEYNKIITLPTAPTKVGYTFSGWSEMPDTMPANNVVVLANFTVNSYKITYTVDGNIYHTDSVAYKSNIYAVNEPTRKGYTFSGWEGLPETMPAEDVTVVGRFTINSYKITYMVDGNEHHVDSLLYAVDINTIPEPTKKGYTFSGWSEIPETMPAEDVTVTGTFIINKYKVTYMVDGEEYHTDLVTYSTSITPIAEPTREGYTFSGWSEIPETMPAEDITIMGTFTPDGYLITYMVDGDTYKVVLCKHGETIVPEAYPIKEGYTFSGWSEIPETMPINDITITGSFTINTYQLTYTVDGEVHHIDSVVYASTIIPIAEPIKEGYTFGGWSEIPETMPAEDITIVGSFILNVRQTDDQGLVYELNQAGDGFDVSNYVPLYADELVIPSELYGVPVITISERALMGADGLKSIVIPSSVTSVGDRVFYACYSLLSVEWNTSAVISATCFDKAENHGNMLVFVNDADTEVSYKGNVIVEGVAEQITISDDMAFRSPQQFTARNISFTRNFDKKTKIGVSGGWEAMVLPFDVQSVVSKNRGELKPFGEADFTTSLPYWLGELQADGTFVATNSITANKPFIMQLPNSDEYEDRYNVEGEVTFSATNVTVLPTTDIEQEAGNGYVMLGSYEGITADSRVYALNDEEYTADSETYMAGGVFVANSRDIRPFEAYVYTTNAGRAPYLRVDNAGETGIGHSIFNVQHSTEIYDLTGRKVLNAEQLKGGIYIVNGKKVIIK